jgi:arylsulfatase A
MLMKIVQIVALLSIALSSLFGANGSEVVRPNFIQILTDDQGWGDLGSYGHQFIQTPHIDRLAAEGIKFTDAYSGGSVCSPSRAAMLTGRTPLRNGVFRFIPSDHFCHLPADEITLPQLLRKEGYQTAHFGKWHLSHYLEERIGDSEDFKILTFGGEHAGQPSMDDYGYDYWFATGNVARPDHKDPINFFLNGEFMGQMEGYSAQIVAAEFVKWMKEARAEDENFFVTIWFHEPHGPVSSDPEFIARYGDIPDPSLVQYWANVTQIDEAVATIVEALEEAGVYDDTMIWYTSDNGPEGYHEFGKFNLEDSPYGGSRYRGSTGGLRGRKRETHEGGIRVPGIITWPNGLEQAGVQPGTLSDEPIIGSDVFPTMLEAAGAPVPEDITLDSTSILPLIQGKAFERGKPLYWRNSFKWRGNYKFEVAIREGEWKLVADSLLNEFELYDINSDPRETTDLSAHYPELFERMKAELIAYDRDVLAEGPTWWRREPRMEGKIPEAPQP